MKEQTRLLILLSIVIPSSILFTYFGCVVLSLDFNIELFVINCTLGFCFLVFLQVQRYLTLQKINSLRYKPQRKLKIGLDIHGCIDSDPSFFGELSRTLIALGHEVHITTGALITDKIKEELKAYGMEWTHLWSISDYYKNKPGVELWYDEKGRPWVDENLWNMAKGDYAKQQELDLCIDDTDIYKKYFSTSIAICSIINKTGKIKEEKAKMPPKPSLTEKKNNLI
mgnify:FL=1